MLVELVQLFFVVRKSKSELYRGCSFAQLIDDVRDVFLLAF